MNTSTASSLFKKSSQIDRRRSLRINPPANLVKEVALWFMPLGSDPTLALADLGVPHLLAVRCSAKIRIFDISAVGMRLAIDKSVFPAVHQIKSGYCYAYLKLMTPLPGKNTLRCLLLGMKFMGLSSDETSIHLRCKIVRRAQPVGASKSFSLFKTEKVGIKEISVWCDEIARMGRGILPPISCCLDMENLLVEIFLQQNMTESLPTT